MAEKGRAKKGNRIVAPPGAPEMAKAWQLYERGDVAASRKLAAEILGGGEDAAGAAEAKELLARTAVPKVAVRISLLVAALILAALSIAVSRG